MVATTSTVLPGPQPRRAGRHLCPGGRLHGAAAVGRGNGCGHRVHRRRAARQAQSIADTAALDMARYINVADWTHVNKTRYHQLPQNGKLANIQHRQQFGECRRSPRPRACVAERTAPVGLEDRRQHRRWPGVLPARSDEKSAMQRCQGHGDAVACRRSSSADPALGDPNLHGRRHARGRLLHRLLPGFRQFAAVRPSSTRSSSTLGTSVNVSAVELSGSGQHLRDDQPAHHGLGRRSRRPATS